MTASKSKLIHQWWAANQRYRLVAVAKFTPGYEDVYVLEVAQDDALGDTRWEEVQRWDAVPTNQFAVIMLKGIESALAQGNPDDAI